jgi:DNA-binding transcriptional regulator of glucitol operon
VARRETDERRSMTTFLLVVGVFVLQVFLGWGYFAVLERGSGSAVARGLVGAALFSKEFGKSDKNCRIFC